MTRRAPDRDFDRDAWLEQKQAKLRAAQDLLETGVEQFTDSDRYREYLAFQAKFGRSYSFHNTLLIFSQRPDASMVMGFRQWQAIGRSVRKGERGIMILVPRTYKKRKEDEAPAQDDQPSDSPEHMGVSFVAGYVFDVAQTEGDPIPDVISELKGTSEHIVELRGAITRVLGDDGYAVEEEHMVGRHYGYISKDKGRVVTREGVEDLQALKTLFHEKGHQLLHVDAAGGEKIPKDQREFEAESVAFVIASFYGLDTSDYSFAYVRSYANDTKLLKDSADRIHHAASQIIDAMETARDTRERALAHSWS